MYKSPIELFHSISPMQELIEKVAEEQKKQQDEYVLSCIHEIGVNVDKDELIKALQYDRQQYEKGYRDGIKACAQKIKEITFRYYDCDIDEVVKEMVGDE